MNWGSAIGGVGTSYLGGQKGRQEKIADNAQKEEAVKQMMFRLALEKAARDQTQANTDRSFGETNRHNTALETAAMARVNDPPKKPALQHVVTEQGVVAFNPEDGSANPVLMGGKPLKPPPQKWQVMGSGGTQEREPNWQVVQTEEGIKQINPKTGEIRDVIQNGQPLQKPMDSATRKAVQDADAVVSTIDKALSELERHPQAIGPLRGRISLVDQKFDPEGVLARAGVADVSSLITLQRSGGAVSDQEFTRIEPIIASVHDLDAKTAATKLKRLRDIFVAKRDGLGGSRAPAPNVNNDMPNDIGPGGGEANDFTRESARLQKAHDDYIARGGYPDVAAKVYEREMAKLRKRTPSVRK